LKVKENATKPMRITMNLSRKDQVRSKAKMIKSITL